MEASYEGGRYALHLAKVRSSMAKRAEGARVAASGDALARTMKRRRLCFERRRAQRGEAERRSNIWVSHKLPWVALGDGLPQFAERRS